MNMFIDEPCLCLGHELYEYKIVEYEEPITCASDFIKKYGAFPSQPERVGPILRYGRAKVVRSIKSWTIGEAFKYIQWSIDRSTEPIHRILDFDEFHGIYREVHSCRLILKSEVKEATPTEKQDLIKLWQANYAKTKNKG